MGFVLVQLDASVVNVAAKSIKADLRGYAAEWAVNTYPVAFAALILGDGFVSGRYGPRRTLMAGLVTLGLASIPSGAASSVGELITFRVFHWLGSALIVASSPAVQAAAYVEARAQATAVRIWAVGGSAALASLMLVGGAVKIRLAVLRARGVFLGGERVASCP